MRRNNNIFRTKISAYRSDGMHVFFPTRTVYIDLYTKLSFCSFRMCSFYELICNKCPYSV